MSDLDWGDGNQSSPAPCAGSRERRCLDDQLELDAARAALGKLAEAAAELYEVAPDMNVSTHAALAKMKAALAPDLPQRALAELRALRAVAEAARVFLNTYEGSAWQDPGVVRVALRDALAVLTPPAGEEG